MMQPDESRAFVSIIVPAFNEERLLRQTLDSIRNAARAFQRRGWKTELIVCDNNSSDRTAAVAREAGATIVFEPVNQIGRARNRGAQAAVGDWLIFIDADSQPSSGLFDDVAQAISSGKYIGGGATLRLDTSHWLASAVTRFWNGISRALRLLAGSFIFCETSAFRQLGGFNEDLFAGEEIELSKRIKLLARSQGKQITILKLHPLLTSERKIHLYTFREHLEVIGKAVITGRRSLRSREHCSTWYDGRR